MAERKCMAPWGELTMAQVAKLAEQAFQLCAYQAITDVPVDEWETPDLFCSGLASAFEALLAQRAQREGHGWLRQDYGLGVEEALAEVPRGFRPAYESGRLSKVAAKSAREAAAAQVVSSKALGKIGEVGVPHACQLAAVTSSWVRGAAS